MLWINLILLSFNLMAKDLPKFFTKHSLDSIRFITHDGRFTYIQKKQGVLGVVSSFKTTDFISNSSQNDFLMRGSRFKQRLIIEVMPDSHQEMNLLKNFQIMVVDWGKTIPTEVGQGRGARLHLNDEWISFYSPSDRLITVKNILTQKKYDIKLSAKLSPFFIPEVEMVSSDTVVYSDINERGVVGLIQYNLITQKGIILYKSSQTGTKLELCQGKNYLAIGEFPYDDINRSSKILKIPLNSGTNLAGYDTIYSSTDSDLGNILCMEKSLYFIKTMTHIKKMNVKLTEVVKLDLASTQIQTMTDLGSVTQMIAMDERVLIPFRGDFYVLEGTSNLMDDKLKAPTQKVEELPLEL